MTKTANEENSGTTEMPLIAHIEELRNALIRCGVAALACAIPCGLYWKSIFGMIVSHVLSLCEPTVRIIYTAPAETVMLSIKIAIICGLILASPIIFQQAWSFISPALYKREKVLAFPTALASTVCFLAGVIFSCYLLPFMLNFLTEFAAGELEPFFKVDEFFSFLIKLALAFGFAFQMPVAAFVFSKIGLIDHKFLLRNFRYAIVFIFIAAAVLTPPDILSQVLLVLPLLVLYTISIIISFFARQKK
ncbi:MAG: twin-arginine translocase subunit TatC [Fibromonadaceae bacterium]|jgi:sec-independent protein translocase protein TatC|nr:twin-arginine translocase subunit TatC [Fibromonadaceae bacterium]